MVGKGIKKININFNCSILIMVILIVAISDCNKKWSYESFNNLKNDNTLFFKSNANINFFSAVNELKGNMALFRFTSSNKIVFLQSNESVEKSGSINYIMEYNPINKKIKELGIIPEYDKKIYENYSIEGFFSIKNNIILIDIYLDKRNKKDIYRFYEIKNNTIKKNENRNNIEWPIFDLTQSLKYREYFILSNHEEYNIIKYPNEINKYKFDEKILGISDSVTIFNCSIGRVMDEIIVPFRDENDNLFIKFYQYKNKKIVHSIYAPKAECGIIDFDQIFLLPDNIWLIFNNENAFWMLNIQTLKLYKIDLEKVFSLPKNRRVEIYTEDISNDSKKIILKVRTGLNIGYALIDIDYLKKCVEKIFNLNK